MSAAGNALTIAGVKSTMRGRRMRIGCTVVLVAAALFLSAQEPPDPGQARLDPYSVEKESALGQQLAAEYQGQSTPIDSRAVQSYLGRVGQRIAIQLQDLRFSFRFTAIVEDPCPTTHEPAALLGGYVFVPAALFVAAQDEAEFAGILAHAMEHIAQRHSIRPVSSGVIVNHGSIPLIYFGNWSGCSEEQSIPAGFLAAQRSVELEADLLAIPTLARAGFDPEGLARYIRRIQIHSGLTETSSALPDPDQRLAIMFSALRQLPVVDSLAVDSSEFAAAQSAVQYLIKIKRPRRAPSLMRIGAQ